MKTDIKKLRRRDNFAGQIIKVSGFITLLFVVSIFVVTFSTSLPLFLPSDYSLRSEFSVNSQPVYAAPGQYGLNALIINEQGLAQRVDIENGDILEEIDLFDGFDKSGDSFKFSYLGKDEFGFLFDDGTVLIQRIAVQRRFEGSDPVLFLKFESKADHKFEDFDESDDVANFSLIGLETGVLLLTSRDASAKAYILSETEDLFGESSSEENTIDIPLGDNFGNITDISFSVNLGIISFSSDTGNLGLFALDQEGASISKIDIFSSSLLHEGDKTSEPFSILTSGWIFGGNTLVISDSLNRTGFINPQKNLDIAGGFDLVKLHGTLKRGESAIRFIPSEKDKSFLLLSDGFIDINHMTSQKHVLRMEIGEYSLVGLNKRMNELAVYENGKVKIYDLELNHPDFSFSAVFGAVDYENYPNDQYIWQSSASNDDFESKISLVPLLFGSLKGTLYSMLFAIPIAVIGAIYTSMFLNRKLKKVVKPIVEIMAAFPSVIIGFMAALWLAPILNTYFVGMVLYLFLFPLSFLIIFIPYQLFLNTPKIQSKTKGYEFLLVLPAFILNYFLCSALSGFVETSFLQGDAIQFLYDTFGIRYDQRNSIVIAFALGFAVIPVIFTVSEDAVSNIPANLKAASLALGANNWQTMMRVVIPSASPGIFAAVILGFGRAIGETMIVLMATGNTPILDWSIFNGMRTLSANIAVEIPEAPHGETLYRVLFLSAVMLFLLTFLLNSFAEIVRQRLRKKYGLI